MQTIEVQSIIQTLVEGCRLTVLVRYGNGHQERSGPSTGGEGQILWPLLNKLWTRLDEGQWWGSMRQVIIRDSRQRTWVLHLYGETPSTGALLAVGPVGDDHPWTIGQLIALLAPVRDRPAPVVPPGSVPIAHKTGESFDEIRQKYQPALLKAVYYGDRATIDLLLERAIARWPQDDLEVVSEKVRSFLDAFVDLVEDSAVLAGLPLAETKQVTVPYRLAFEGIRNVRACILTLMPMLRDLADRVAGNPVRGQSAKGRALVRFLQAKLDQPITLQDAADHVGLTPGYAGTLFKKEVGTGFAETLQRVRIDRAAGLLRSTGSSVRDIARQVGFRYPNHFSRVFRAVTGQSPQDYRRSVSEIVERFPLETPSNVTNTDEG